MGRHSLDGRLRRVERRVGASDRGAWFPLGDERDDLVRHAVTGEVATPDAVRARNGRDVVVQYADGGPSCG
jgi:hypothetical protein